MSDVGGLVPRAFFARPARLVAPELLGRVLVRRDPEGEVALRITEVEAYEGELDPASHGYRGPTPRNATMFGPPGHLYVYWVYGMHHAANLVCGADGECQAVLVRAGEVIHGQALAAARRPNARRPQELAKGPGRLALSLDFDRGLDGTDVCAPGAAVTVHQGVPCPADAIRSGPRTGVSKGHETPWRFWVADDPTVSPYRRHTPRTRPPRTS
ncbi:DNA-3-methyladenine glycosylase [Streptacidiphilus sp. P02-A3a]|uniref:DNA-3-methyladenine glycosylase n=1 Tax=Streptacidiphilus sp. P02-A3a TaxID=2704468 RepID=UPI0015F7A85A|nr:DNA-3-methyladenine glycosylase [Streptacidiphilus sp. P02-A3a]QMU71896.1 DNA-3-methyladenine glycosylase [Streptacidiphilus sp. P02-A3a]